MPAPLDPSEVLLAKAKDDANLAAKLNDDPSVSDEYIGFFCQQAVEKSLKAILSQNRIVYRWTHDLSQLLLLLAENGVTPPAELHDCVALTPFAAALRYEFLPEDQGEPEPFNRDEAVKIAARAVAWANTLVGPKAE